MAAKIRLLALAVLLLSLLFAYQALHVSHAQAAGLECTVTAFDAAV